MRRGVVVGEAAVRITLDRATQSALGSRAACLLVGTGGSPALLGAPGATR